MNPSVSLGICASHCTESASYASDSCEVNSGPTTEQSAAPARCTCELKKDESQK